MSIRSSLGLWVTLFIALLSILVAGPFWQTEGIPANTHDVQVHFHRSAAIERAFEQGVFWPRWFPAVYNGLGAPVFHYYSPGLHWLVAAGHGIGLGLDQALKLVMTAALVLSGFGVYAWIRHAFSPAASLAATALYLLHPGLLVRTVYFGGDYPQMLALLLLPVCLWAFTALHRQSRPRNWFAAAASLAASGRQSQPDGDGRRGDADDLVGSADCRRTQARRPAALRRGRAAGRVAALLTGGFWLPALADLPLVQSGNFKWGAGNFSDLFLQWWQLTGVQSPILDSRAGNPLRPLNTFGAATWLAVAAGLLSVLFSIGRERRVWALSGGAFALAMLAMATPLSEPLWESFAELAMFQYPARFLLIAPLGALPAAASAVDVWRKGYRWLPSPYLGGRLHSCSLPLPVSYPYTDVLVFHSGEIAER